MPLATDLGLKAAKAGVTAARKSAARAIRRGEDRAEKAVSRSAQGLDAGLELVERVLHGGLESVASKGRSVERRAAQVLPSRFAAPSRRGLPPVATAVTGLGAGILLAMLFAPREGPAA
jgi:hypothetical protein